MSGSIHPSIHPSIRPSVHCVLHTRVCLCFQVIMRMLRVGRGMVETVLKTSQFFPSKLPQYQGQCVGVPSTSGFICPPVSQLMHVIKCCSIRPLVITNILRPFSLVQSQREMFLMRKNHLDFKTLAQALAMNKDKLEYYVAVSQRTAHLPSPIALKRREPDVC